VTRARVRAAAASAALRDDEADLIDATTAVVDTARESC
jgi:hypothetical protein